MSIIRRLVTNRHVQLVSRMKPLSTTLNYKNTLSIISINKSLPSSVVRRNYTSTATNKAHQASKISSMASSPSIIDAAKAETKKPSKMKTLTKKYGAVGIIVYVAIGCIDLGITLGVIQLVGLDKVKALERAVLDTLFRAKDKFGSNTNATASNETALDSMVEKRKEKDDNSTPSFASIFILAYGIHKTLLLPVRLGITAAITPAVVRKIHQLGWARYFPGLKNLSKPHQTPTSTIK